MARSDYVDKKYYEVATPGSFSERLMIKARDRIYDAFVAKTEPKPTDTILDVGVSDVLSGGANVLERKYPYLNRITACGLGVADEFQAEFPDVGYVQIEPNSPLPFADKHFDIATANAVLEHVGSRQAQETFLSEMSRVARKVFVTVPNRYFPVEHHTGIPLLHFADGTFGAACAWSGKTKWTDPANLILMSRSYLIELSPAGMDVDAGYTGLSLGPFSSNLYLYLSGK